MNLRDSFKASLAGLVLGASTLLGGCGVIVHAIVDDEVRHQGEQRQIEKENQVKRERGYTIPGDSVPGRVLPRQDWEVPLEYLPPDVVSKLKQDIIAVTANIYEDKNRNNLVDFPEEFSGIKENFKIGERAEVVFSIPRPIPNIRYVLVDENMRKIEEGSVDRQFIVKAFYDPRIGAPQNQVNSLQAGKYTAQLYSGSVLLKEANFRVGDATVATN